MPEPNGTEPYMTVRDMVAEIRRDVKELKGHVATLPTRAEFDDHEARIRGTERWRYGVPVSVIAAITALFVPHS